MLVAARKVDHDNNKSLTISCETMTSDHGNKARDDCKNGLMIILKDFDKRHCVPRLNCDALLYENVCPQSQNGVWSVCHHILRSKVTGDTICLALKQLIVLSSAIFKGLKIKKVGCSDQIYTWKYAGPGFLVEFSLLPVSLYQLAPVFLPIRPHIYPIFSPSKDDFEYRPRQSFFVCEWKVL